MPNFTCLPSTHVSCGLCSSSSSRLTLQAAGVAALLAFIVENWTGPSLPDDDAWTKTQALLSSALSADEDAQVV